MTVVYHPDVQRDVNGILRHYDRISHQLGNEFWDELMSCLQAAARNPKRFHFANRGLRRVNLRRFPYHLLFRELPGRIRITVVRHNRRHPGHAIKRK